MSLTKHRKKPLRPVLMGEREPAAGVVALLKDMGFEGTFGCMADEHQDFISQHSSRESGLSAERHRVLQLIWNASIGWRMRYAGRWNDPDKKDRWVRYTQTEIATILGLTDESVHRDIKILKDLKLIDEDSRRGFYVLPKPRIPGAKPELAKLLTKIPKSLLEQRENLVQQIISRKAKYKAKVEERIKDLKEEYQNETAEVNKLLHEIESQINDLAATLADENESEISNVANREPQISADSTTFLDSASFTAQSEQRCSLLVSKDANAYKEPDNQTKLHKKTPSVGRTSEKTEQPDRPTQIKQAIIETGIPSQLGDAPSLRLCEQVQHRFGSTPLDYALPALKNRMTLRKPDILKHGLGLVLKLAEDVKDAYRETASGQEVLINGRKYTRDGARAYLTQHAADPDPEISAYAFRLASELGIELERRSA